MAAGHCRAATKNHFGQCVVARRGGRRARLSTTTITTAPRGRLEKRYIMMTRKIVALPALFSCNTSCNCSIDVTVHESKHPLLLVREQFCAIASTPSLTPTSKLPGTVSLGHHKSQKTVEHHYEAPIPDHKDDFAGNIFQGVLSVGRHASAQWRSVCATVDDARHLIGTVRQGHQHKPQ